MGANRYTNIGQYYVEIVKWEENPMIYSQLPILTVNVIEKKYLIQIPDYVVCQRGGISMPFTIDLSRNLPY